MPEPARVVVMNTTPLIGLSLIGQLDILRQLFAEVLIPPAVQEEVLAGGPNAIGAPELARAAYIRVTPLRDQRRAGLLTDLDRGEAEVIALALELNADLVVLDERLARLHAKRLGLRVTGLLGLLLRAKAAGHVRHLLPLLAQLREGGFWLSDALVSETLRLAGER